MPVPVASVPVFSALDTCSGVRIQTHVVEVDDRPRGVLAKHLLHNVALGELALNLL